MFSAVRRSAASALKPRNFTTTASPQDVAKLTLVGRIGVQPEVRTTKNDKEYVVYKVVTNSYPPSSSDSDDSALTKRATWHTILSFRESANAYLTTIQKGSQVYVEAAYELREPDRNAEPDSPAAQRQIFLRHEAIKVLSRPKSSTSAESEEGY
ncbi:hypothetical protein BDW22DRAFT_1351889 [Trametopsis cervina]|nr:hypothetical protein BDW22DRAFT_1351889 [Trametopsis cervina]